MCVRGQLADDCMTGIYIDDDAMWEVVDARSARCTYTWRSDSEADARLAAPPGHIMHAIMRDTHPRPPVTPLHAAPNLRPYKVYDTQCRIIQFHPECCQNFSTAVHKSFFLSTVSIAFTLRLANVIVLYLVHLCISVWLLHYTIYLLTYLETAAVISDTRVCRCCATLCYSARLPVSDAEWKTLQTLRKVVKNRPLVAEKIIDVDLCWVKINLRRLFQRLKAAPNYTQFHHHLFSK